MLTVLIVILRSIGLICRGHRAVALENLALRQQVAALTRTVRRPQLRTTDRLFWILLAKAWPEWRTALLVVRPDTVVTVAPPMAPTSVDVALHADTSRAPSTDAAVRALVGTMAAANPLWGRLGFTANCASWASRRQSARCRGSCGNRSAARRRRGGPF